MHFFMFLEVMKKVESIDLPLNETMPEYFFNIGVIFSVNSAWICRYDLNETSSITH